jgi:hypothetical protein
VEYLASLSGAVITMDSETVKKAATLVLIVASGIIVVVAIWKVYQWAKTEFKEGMTY